MKIALPTLPSWSSTSPSLRHHQRRCRHRHFRHSSSFCRRCWPPNIALAIFIINMGIGTVVVDVVILIVFVLNIVVVMVMVVGVFGLTPSWSLSLPRLINFNFPCSPTRNITSHSMKNMVFHSLLRQKMIPPILTTSPIHFLYLVVKGLIVVFYLQLQCSIASEKTSMM